MTHEAITLVLAMAIGTVLMAAWDTPEQQATPEAALVAPTPAQKKNTPYWEYVPLPEDVARGPGSVQVALRPLALT